MLSIAILEVNNMTKEMNITIKSMKRALFLRSLNISFFGGIIWGSLFLLLYVFNIVDIDPTIVLQFILDQRPHDMKWFVKIIAILVIGILSIMIGMLYYWTLKQITSWLAGALFGTFLWSVVFVLLPLFKQQVNYFAHHDIAHHIATFSIFLLYGVFVGYSISFDYDNMKREYMK